MNRLLLRAHDAQLIRSMLLKDSARESAAIMFAHVGRTQTGYYRLMVNEIESAPDDAYLERSGASLTLSPHYLSWVMKRARLSRRAIVLGHSHPGGGRAWPSLQDTRAEASLLPVLLRQNPGFPNARLIVTRSDAHFGIIAAELHAGSVVSVGSAIEELTSTESNESTADVYHRQALAFGNEGQRAIRRLATAVVGLGGTGSIVAQQLAHLGVSSFLLIDPDRIEVTNLNRLVGAAPEDVGRLKVDVAMRTIRSVRPAADVRTIADTVVRDSVARSLLDFDLVFCCTDGHGSRAILNALAYQYYLPVIDMGVRIDVSRDGSTRTSGRAQMLAPGLPCLVCGSVLDPEEVRRELLSEDERRADPYIVGAATPAPAVITINSLVASLATTQMLAAFAGFRMAARHQVLLGERGVVRSIAGNPVDGCVLCSSRGVLAAGDGLALPTRKE